MATQDREIHCPSFCPVCALFLCALVATLGLVVVVLADTLGFSRLVALAGAGSLVVAGIGGLIAVVAAVLVVFGDENPYREEDGPQPSGREEHKAGAGNDAVVHGEQDRVVVET